MTEADPRPGRTASAAATSIDPSRPIRVAVLGFWHVHAADYARQAKRRDGTELVGIWDDDPVRGRAAAETLGTTWTDDLDALLSRTDVDAVTVTTETSIHRDVIVRAARAGKHVFSEKLLAPTVAEAEEILAVADGEGVKAVVSLPRLAAGYTDAVSDVIAGGRLGRITHGRVRLSHDGAVPRDGGQGWLPERFFEPASAVGGALTDLGCHPVYLIQRFLGPTPETISATYRSVTDRKVEDQAVVSVGYPNGAIGVIEASFVGRTPFSIEISGTDGALRYVDDGSGLVVSNRSAGADAVEALPVPADRPDPFDQWVGHIRSNTRADDNLSRAVELTRLVVASNRAAREGRTITYLEG